MNQGSTFAVFRLLEVPGVGPARVRAISSLADASALPLAELISETNRLGAVLTDEQIRALHSNATKSSETWQKLNEEGVVAVSVFDRAYPGILQRVLANRAPLLLFVLGNATLLGKPALGFCGSRKASEKGLAVAQECAEIVTEEGINVVSGYAAGVDMATHRAALKNGGTTAVVLPEGIFHFRVKRELKDFWDWERTVVISEYSPGATWSVHNAMKRNQTICALCRAVVLIEARETGGSIEAGRTCLKLGIPLFAPVYEGMPDSASGNRILLSEGARSLYKNKSTKLPNLRGVFDTFSSSAVQV
jgi:DNA processing protein